MQADKQINAEAENRQREYDTRKIQELTTKIQRLEKFCKENTRGLNFNNSSTLNRWYSSSQDDLVTRSFASKKG